MDTNKIITHGEFLTKVSEFYGVTGTTLINNVLMPEKDYIFDGQWPDTEFSTNKCLQRFPNNEFNTTKFWGRISEKYDEYLDSRTGTTSYVYNEVYDYTTVNPLKFDSTLKNNQLLSYDSIDWEQNINIISMVDKIKINITTFYDGGLSDNYKIRLGTGKCYNENLDVLWNGFSGKAYIGAQGDSDGSTIPIKYSSKLFVDENNNMLPVNGRFGFSIQIERVDETTEYGVFQKYSSVEFDPSTVPDNIETSPSDFYLPESSSGNINTFYRRTDNKIDKSFDDLILNLNVALCRPGVDTMKHIDLSVFNNNTPYSYNILDTDNPNRQCKFVLESDGTVNPYNVKISLCDAISETSGKVCTSRSVGTVCFRDARKYIPLVGQQTEYVANLDFDAFDYNDLKYEAWSTGPYSTHHLNIFQDTIETLNDGTVPMALNLFPKRLAFQNEQGLWIILGYAASIVDTDSDITLPSLMDTTKQEIIPVNDGSLIGVGLDLSIARQIVNDSGYNIKLYPYADETDLRYYINSGETLSCMISPYFSIKFTNLPSEYTSCSTTITLNDNITIGSLSFFRGNEGGIVDVYTYAQDNFNTNADGSVNYFPLRGGDTLTIQRLTVINIPVNPNLPGINPGIPDVEV